MFFGSIKTMVLIIGCALFVSIFTLFYLQQKFRFSTLAHEIEQMRTEKKKLLIEIDKVRIEAAKYSSMRRVDELFSTLLNAGDEPRGTSPSLEKQKITTLKVPILSAPAQRLRNSFAGNRLKGDSHEENGKSSEGAQGVKSPSQSEPKTEHIIIRQHE